jgi:hypothetical protein
MVFVLRPQPDERAIVEPEMSPLWLLLGHLEPLALPDPLDPLVIHTSALKPKQRRDASVPVPPVHARKLDDPLRQRLLIAAHDGKFRCDARGCFRILHARLSEIRKRPRM